MWVDRFTVYIFLKFSQISKGRSKGDTDCYCVKRVLECKKGDNSISRKYKAINSVWININRAHQGTVKRITVYKGHSFTSQE